LTFGNYVNWNTSEWALDRMESWEKEYCQDQKPIDVLLPVNNNFTASQLLCKKYGGNMTVVSSVEKQYELFRNRHYQQQLMENRLQSKII
jgi:hypothetical protein